MKKITVSINENVLSFKYRTNKSVSVDLLNTNVISNNELVFSDEYIQNNLKIVSLFISDLAKEKNITKVDISNSEMVNLILDVIKPINKIECLTIKDDVPLAYAICERIIKSKNILKVNCYSIPTFMLEILDQNNILVESRNEVLFTSNFMQDNNLTSFSKMYYKASISIGIDITENDIEDFKTFCKINKYLKVIVFKAYDYDIMQKFIEVLESEKKKKILIEIHDDINNPEDIAKLRMQNKLLKAKYKIKLSLVYSKDYLEKNYLKQIIFTTLKICSVIIFAIISSVMGYILYNNYKSEQKVEAITADIKSLLIDDENEDVPLSEIPAGTSYTKLKSINEDTVGWLTVLNTKIDYPVVQTKDNSYYLNRNFYKQKDYNGWVFMDYRNNPKKLDKNTILYAHNRYYSGVMFGTLNNVTKWKWYSNSDNLYITFNTMDKNMKWKIFSIYSIDVTSDYLYINFDTTTEFKDFLTKIKNRSKVKLSTKVTEKDNILTLSTCLDNNKRLVVHAVLVE